jgi:UrcA family protein
MKTSIRSALSASLLLLIGWTAAASAAPDNDGELVTKTVRFGDLDLSTAVGAQALYGRITVAARDVCRGSASYRSMHACRAAAVENAVRGVASPLLSSVHRSTVDAVEEVVRR